MLIELRPIHNKADYSATLAEIEHLFTARPGTVEGDRLEILVTLVEQYENQHFPIPLPDPIEALKYHMTSRGLDRRDLQPFIGSRARVSEILNRRRPLTLRMIRALSEGLGISADILVQPYLLESKAFAH